MSGPVTTELRGDVLIVRADNPPVNALSQAVRAGLVEAIAAANADPAVRAVIIACAGRTFFAGADITEFGRPPIDPWLPEVVARIEASDKPVVAAIHGTALGGGLEVALGAHYRIAVPSARLGLPEVKLGLIPGAGGTQRLPRLVGLEAALPIMVNGDPISAARALEIGLVDRLAEETRLEEDALAFAAEVAALPAIPRTGERSLAPAEPGLIERFKAENPRRFRGYEAPHAVLQAVEAAATLPLAQGLARERELFAGLMAGEQSRALRHVFFAERAAARIEGLPADTPLLPIETVGIVGAGTMGGGIAMTFLSAGLPVTLVETSEAALERGVATIRSNYEATVKKGRLSEAAFRAAMERLTPTLDYDALADRDLVVEAVFETMEVKLPVFARLDAVVQRKAILATNTSYLDVDAIAAATSRPGQVLGLHFFSPANVMRLLEVVRGAKTEPAVLRTAMELGRRLGKVAVVAGVCHGFIGNRMLRERQAAAEELILSGVTPWRVDGVLTAFGFPMGPFQMADLAGLDLGWTREASRGSTIRELLCEQDRRGQKSGCGFYDYDAARRGSPSPETEAIIAGFAARQGRSVIEVSDEEILGRLLFPMVDEGARILSEGIAQRASDIDVVWLNGYGWPQWTGGPMFWADSYGLKRIAGGLERMGRTPAPLLAQTAGAGGRLSG